MDSKEVEKGLIPSSSDERSHKRAEKVVQSLEQSRESSEQTALLPYEVSYSDAGLLKEVRFEDGYRLAVEYAQDPNGLTNAVTLSDGGLAVSFRSADTMPKKLDKKNLLEELLSILKKDARSLPDQKQGVDFLALRKSFELFRDLREKAFRGYRDETEAYYEALATIILEADQNEPDQASMSRGEIDQRVSEVMQSDLETLKDSVHAVYAEKIRLVQPKLYRAHVLPAGEQMNRSLESGFRELLANVEKMFHVRGKTSVMQDGNSVEIVIAVN